MGCGRDGTRKERRPPKEEETGERREEPRMEEQEAVKKESKTVRQRTSQDGVCRSPLLALQGFLHTIKQLGLPHVSREGGWEKKVTKQAVSM